MSSNDHSKICSLCRTRRAKRRCPALANDICPICCATKRARQIQCPTDCRYLRQGLAYRSARKEQLEEREKERPSSGFGEEYKDILHDILYSILEVKRRLYPDLSQEEVREALNLLIRTHETLEKGIIYQFSSTSATIQSVINAVQKVLEMRKKRPDLRQIDIRETIHCLRYVLTSTIENEEAWGEYMNLTARGAPITH